ncbi:MAG: FHA domain-containing protein [Chloroflexi bacterium]|nr:FHA domain-containing protein [Chloroflexota bacterium]
MTVSSARLRWEGHEYLLTEPETWIGRDALCQVVLENRYISARHARIVRQETGYFLQDLDSRNGTWLNGEQLSPQQLAMLHHGDAIGLARLITLTFLTSSTLPPTARLPESAGLWLNPETHDVWVNNIPLDPPLPESQYRLLAFLYATPNLPHGRDKIIAAVWPDVDPQGITDMALDSLVMRLRKRLKEVDPDREYIHTRRGFGYTFVQPE